MTSMKNNEITSKSFSFPSVVCICAKRWQYNSFFFEFCRCFGVLY